MTFMSRLLATAAAATLGAVASLTLLTGPASATTYTAGHLDLLDVDYVNNALTLDVKIQSGATPVGDDVSPAGHVFRVLPTWTITVPSASAWSCLGTAGSTVYVAPEAYDANKLYAGWNTEDVAAAQGPVKMELVSATSVPSGGRFALYQNVVSGFSTVPSFKLNSATGSCNLQTWPSGVAAGAHGHGNWAFSQAGTYTLTFKATAQNGVGATSGNVTYTFQVG